MSVDLGPAPGTSFAFDRKLVRTFWETYNADADMDAQLIDLVAAARQHGETVGEMKGRERERHLWADLVAKACAVVDRFVEMYSYGGWFMAHLPPELIAKLSAATQAFRVESLR
jgi:hypothetical protein